MHEAFATGLFGDTPLGRPILSTTDSVRPITSYAPAPAAERIDTVADTLVLTVVGALAVEKAGRAGHHPVRRVFSLIEGAVGELAVIWDLAAVINAGSRAGVIVLELGQRYGIRGEDDGF